MVVWCSPWLFGVLLLFSVFFVSVVGCFVIVCCLTGFDLVICSLLLPGGLR